jgi:hypothetical protein
MTSPTFAANRGGNAQPRLRQAPNPPGRDTVVSQDRDGSIEHGRTGPTTGVAMPTMMYFPALRPPPEVMYQALLYWDGFASVVPHDQALQRALVRGELAELEARGIYSPVSVDGVTLMRDSPEAEALRSELRRLAIVGPTGPADSFIWIGKATFWLEDELRLLGLAVHRPDSTLPFEKLIVSKEVEATVVGVLARELARASSWGGKSYFPYTDDDTAYGRALWPLHGHAGIPAWQMELGRLLPVPTPSTGLEEVLQFRERYADERVRLMRALHRMLGDLRRDYGHPADVLRGLREELDQASRDYESARRATRFTWIQRSVMVTVAVAAAAGGSLLIPEVDWAFATASGFAINAATRDVRPLGRDSARGDSEDFSYLHRVRSELD